MKKLMILLGSISLFAPSSAMLISCSKAKKEESKFDVKFEKSDYTVLTGAAVTVNISNFSYLQKVGYTNNCSVVIDDPTIAKFVDTQENDVNKNYQTLQISGISAGTTKVTVEFTNLANTDVKEGTFNITVMDFSQYQVNWDTDTKTIDPLAEKIKVGNLPEYQKFTNLNYKDFSINMKSENENSTDINLLLNGCEIDEKGDIYLNVDYSQLPPLGEKQKEYTLGTVTFTLLNTSANYTSNTGDISFNPFKGVRNFTIEKSNENDINLKNPQDFTVKFNDNIPFSDIEKSKPKITFSGGSDGDFTATPKFSEASTLVDVENSSYTLNLTFTFPPTSYASGNITIDIRFSSGHFVYYTNQSFKYSANRVSAGGQYDKPTDNDIGYVSKYSDSNIFKAWQTDKPAPQSISITTSSKLDDIVKGGYKYKDTLTIADNQKGSDADYYSWSKLNNFDLSESENAKNFKALDSKTSFSKITAFSIDTISVNADNNLILNIKKLEKQVTDGGTIHFISRFYDDIGNVCCATAKFTYSQSNIPVNIATFTRGKIPYSDQSTNQGDSLSNSIHLTDDDLSFDSFSVSADDPEKLATSTIRSDNPEILSVENNLEKKYDNKYYIKMKLIGQKGKDVERGKARLTLKYNDNNFALDVYYGTFIGADASSGNYEILNNKTSGSVNYFISSNASNRAIDVSYSSNYGVNNAPNLEFANGYNYSGSESPFKFNDYSSIIGDVTFDGDINVTGRGVVSVSYANKIYGNILFKGNVTYTANNDKDSEACGVISEQYLSDAYNSTRISEDKEINFMKDVKAYATDNIGSGVGIINTIMTGAIGQVNVEGSVFTGQVSSGGWQKLKPVGIIYSKSSSWQTRQGFDSLKGLNVKGSASIDRCQHLVYDYGAIIYNCDQFCSPIANINIGGEVSGGPLLYSISSTSNPSKVFSLYSINISKFTLVNFFYRTVVELQTGAGFSSYFTVKIGDKTKEFHPKRYASLETFTLDQWNI
ncbi:hypothetical protein [Spiroplasma endosymbiont of Aspidapion aeneum]|uniref:hypothetical protein n=1 Tax=Spiroplasma endosymbiont of Aspidapion aeneum TaxID=3066276 RepID=UPI00313C6C89